MSTETQAHLAAIAERFDGKHKDDITSPVEYDIFLSLRREGWVELSSKGYVSMTDKADRHYSFNIRHTS